jgi:hypothetical protein
VDLFGHYLRPMGKPPTIGEFTAAVIQGEAEVATVMV